MTRPLATSGELNFDNGYSIDAALGVNLGGGLSLEGQLGYLNADLTDATYGIGRVRR